MIYTPYYNDLVRYFYLKENAIETQETIDVRQRILNYQALPNNDLNITPIDAAIRTALQNISVSSIPAFMANGRLGVPNNTEYPACIYDLEAGDRIGENGEIIRTVLFYMFTNRVKDLDILNDVNPKQEVNTKKIYEFIRELNASKFNTTVIGSFTSMHDQTTILEVGKEFKIDFSWMPC